MVLIVVVVLLACFSCSDSSAVDWNNPALQTTTPDILSPTPPSNFVPKYNIPPIAPGAAAPSVLPYDTTRGLARSLFGSGITTLLLNASQDAWIQLMPLAAAAAQVPISQAPEVFIRQAIYTLLLWHPEYMPLYHVQEAKDIWTDPSLNARMVKLGNELNWQFTNMTVYEPQNLTSNFFKLIDDSAYDKYEESLESGHVYYNLPYFAFLVDAELAASEFFLGAALSDQAYSGFQRVLEYINLRTFNTFDEYTMRCLRRYSISKVHNAGQTFNAAHE